MDIVQHLSSARSGILNNDNSQLLNWGLWVFRHCFVTGIQSFLCRIISISIGVHVMGTVNSPSFDHFLNCYMSGTFS
jgi:hypothetical protein